MLIIGRDFHTRYQQIAMMDDATGELVGAAAGSRRRRNPQLLPRLEIRDRRDVFRWIQPSAITAVPFTSAKN